MSGDSRYAYENLTHSGLLRVNSKEDKEVSLSIDVFGGFTSIGVWTGAGGKPWKMTISRKAINFILILLKKMKADVRPDRQHVGLNIWDTEAKKMKSIGQIGFGIDESLTFVIDVSHNQLPNRYTFPIKGDGKFDFSNTSLTDKESLIAIINYVIEIFEVISPEAERMTSFKRDPKQNNNQRNGGNSSYNNNGNRAPQNSTFGSSDYDSDLAI